MIYDKSFQETGRPFDLQLGNEDLKTLNATNTEIKGKLGPLSLDDLLLLQFHSNLWKDLNQQNALPGPSIPESVARAFGHH